MMVKHPAAVNFSVWLYRLLLWLYPERHRLEYGPLMAQVFRDQCRTAYRKQGTWGVLWVWFPLMVDLAVTLAEEYRQEGIRMSKDVFVRYGGSLLMLGGLSWGFASVSQLQPGSHYNFWGIYMLSFMLFIPALILCSVGLIGVGGRYSVRLGRVGNFALTPAVIGGIVGGAAFFIMPFLGDAGWGIFMLSIIVHFLSLAVFGFTTIRSRALPAWNWLPVVIGILPLLSFALALATNEGDAFGPQWPTFAMMVVVGGSWLAIGYGIQADQRQEQPATA